VFDVFRLTRPDGSSVTLDPEQRWRVMADLLSLRYAAISSQTVEGDEKLSLATSTGWVLDIERGTYGDAWGFDRSGK
jgi:hypothetical protein